MVTGEEHWTRAKAWLPTAFGLAILPNTIEAFTDIDGTLWLAVRLVLSTLFVLALIYWIVAFVQHRRSAAEPDSRN